MVNPEGLEGEHEHEYQVLTVAEAARMLGITSGAVRSRIQRGQLYGYKQDGQWRVVLNSHGVAPHDQSLQQVPAEVSQRQPGQPAVNEAARQQLEAIRDEWLQPLVDQLTEQSERIGYLESERDELRRRVQELESERGRYALDSEEDLVEERRRPRLPGPIVQRRLVIVILVWALWMAAVVWLGWQFLW